MSGSTGVAFLRFAVAVSDWPRDSAVGVASLQQCVALVLHENYAAVRSMAGLRSRTLVFFAESCAWSRASSNSVARSYLYPAMSGLISR